MLKGINKSASRVTAWERTENAFALAATGESAMYANIILRKGVVK